MKNLGLIVGFLGFVLIGSGLVGQGVLAWCHPEMTHRMLWITFWPQELQYNLLTFGGMGLFALGWGLFNR